MLHEQRFVDYAHDPVTLAKRLLGQRLVRSLDGFRTAGIIVEVEAYLGAKDKAAHTHGGRRTARNASMWLPGGHAYVYFTYGMHYCFNVVGGRKDEGVAVLIRAIQPEEGLDWMRRRRERARRDRDLCSGPAKLTQALAIDRTLDGIDLRISPSLWIEQVRKRRVPDRLVRGTPRVGVGYADEWAEKLLRFSLRDSEYVSRK